MCIVSGKYAKEVIKEVLKKPSKKALKHLEKCSKLVERLRSK
jgi:hypothetical protein